VKALNNLPFLKPEAGEAELARKHAGFCYPAAFFILPSSPLQETE
jgi:hypothetical protein